MSVKARWCEKREREREKVKRLKGGVLRKCVSGGRSAFHILRDVVVTACSNTVPAVGGQVDTEMNLIKYTFQLEVSIKQGIGESIVFLRSGVDHDHARFVSNPPFSTLLQAAQALYVLSQLLDCMNHEGKIPLDVGQSNKKNKKRWDDAVVLCSVKEDTRSRAWTTNKQARLYHLWCPNRRPPEQEGVTKIGGSGLDCLSSSLLLQGGNRVLRRALFKSLPCDSCMNTSPIGV